MKRAIVSTVGGFLGLGAMAFGSPPVALFGSALFLIPALTLVSDYLSRGVE